MSLQLLWYMLAAFIMGFALSTLWEWFYFRGVRVRLRDERVTQLEKELATSEGELARYRSAEAGVVTSTTYATASMNDAVAEFQSSAAHLESEQRELAEAALRFPPREADPRDFTEPTRDAFPPDAPTPFEPEDEFTSSRRYTLADEELADEAPVDEEVDEVLADETPAPAEPGLSAARLSASNPPVRTITATPQAHAELAELIARLEEVEKKQAARAELVERTEGRGDVEPMAASAGRNEEVSKTDILEAPHRQNAAPVPQLDAEPQSSAVESSPATATDKQLTVAPLDRADDLMKIAGLGNVYITRLQEGGIFTWRQIAESDPETLRALTNARSNTQVVSWIAQAADLMRQHNQPDSDDPFI